MCELKGNFEMESASYDRSRRRRRKGEKKENEDAGARSTVKCHYVFIVAIEIEESRRHYNFVQFSRFTSKERATSDFQITAIFPVFIICNGRNFPDYAQREKFELSPGTFPSIPKALNT